jgi:threonine dehydrogenase-like Zn-dependent dehydrogenase
VGDQPASAHRSTTRIPLGFESMMGNITLTGGAAPARAYIEELLPDILDGRIDPGRVFDHTVGIDGVPEGYRRWPTGPR